MKGCSERTYACEEFATGKLKMARESEVLCVFKIISIMLKGNVMIFEHKILWE